MTDKSPRGTHKAIMSKEIVTLLHILPGEQILRIDLTWLRREDLRRLYIEIRKTMIHLDYNKINIFG